MKWPTEEEVLASHEFAALDADSQRAVREGFALPGSLQDDIRRVPAIRAFVDDPEYHTPPSKPLHYHGADTTAYVGKSCEQCAPAFARDFIAKAQAQKGSFLTPAPADYLACDRTINEERERLRWEFLAYHGDALFDKAIEVGADYIPDRDALIEAIVDKVCPRAWLDRRLKEVL